MSRTDDGAGERDLDQAGPRLLGVAGAEPPPSYATQTQWVDWTSQIGYELLPHRRRLEKLDRARPRRLGLSQDGRRLCQTQKRWRLGVG